MRAPLSEIEPVSVGVSILTRGEAASAASRVSAVTVPGAPGTCGVGAGCGGLRRGSGLRLRGAGRLLRGLRLLLLRLLLLLHLRQADENLPSDQHERRQHDGEERVLLVGHPNGSYRSRRPLGVAQPAFAAPVRWSVLWRPAYLVAATPQQSPRSFDRTADPTPGAARLAHNHVRDASVRRPNLSRLPSTGVVRDCVRRRSRLSW